VIGPRARGRATAAFLEFLRQVLKREPRAA
jgi:hypothetical protein